MPCEQWTQNIFQIITIVTMVLYNYFRKSPCPDCMMLSTGLQSLLSKQNKEYFSKISNIQVPRKADIIALHVMEYITFCQKFTFTKGKIMSWTLDDILCISVSKNCLFKFLMCNFLLPFNLFFFNTQGGTTGMRLRMITKTFWNRLFDWTLLIIEPVTHRFRE